MTEAHQNICRSLSLVYFKPNDIIYNQGDIGDSFYYILNGSVKQTIHKKIDPPLFPNSSNKNNSNSPVVKYKNSNNVTEENEGAIIEVKKIFIFSHHFLFKVF